MQGAQSGGWRTISAIEEKGLVVSGLVGPKMTSVGRPSAAATCAGPVSLVTSRSTAERTSTACERLVLPVKITGLCFIRLATSRDTSSSSGEPISKIWALDSINRSAKAAKRSAGQRLARLLIEPGHKAITR